MTPASASPPFFIHDRYRLAEWLGTGRMGLVYRALDEKLDRQVVIKFLDAASQPAHSERFLREARAIARLAHPNIMAIYDVGQQDGWDYLVLEYIPGRDLRKLQNQYGGKLPVAETLPIIAAILQALRAAHEQGIIHRDIKPENILITPEKQVKVADFGLALAAGEARLTQEGAIVGTALYLAPECLGGGYHDARSDLYAVGAMLYELLTGRPPFEGESLVSVIAKVVQGEVTPPGMFNPEVTPALESYILRLMARDPGQRPASAMEAFSALPTVSQPGLAQPEPQVTTVPVNLSAALEAERRRLAAALKTQTIEPLNLLLAQVSTFEQTLGAQPQARMALSVLMALIRQTLQQSRDLEANLHPVVLESLGLEPALEALKEQLERAKGLRLILEVERFQPRLAAGLELGLFRLLQELLDELVASPVTLQLKQREAHLELALTYASAGSLPEKTASTARARAASLNGQVKLLDGNPLAGLEISIPLRASTEFTARELEVLQCLAAGLSNKEIAGRLSISPRTVNYHLDNIFAKLGVNSRTEAALIAMRQGWAKGPSDVGPR